MKYKTFCYVLDLNSSILSKLVIIIVFVMMSLIYALSFHRKIMI